MSEWRSTPAGKIARQRREVVRLEPGAEYRTMGVRWYGRGAYDRGVVTTETVKANSLFRARVGDFTFNRIDTQKGAFNVVPAELDGALATNEFPLYEVNEEEVDARFLLLSFLRPEVLSQIGTVRAGSEGRARWKEPDFEAWMVDIPPLSVQERIVEAIGAVDTQIAALGAEVTAAQRLLNMLLADHFLTIDGDAQRIVDLCSHVVGGVWGKPEGKGEVNRLALGPRIYAPGTSDFVTDGSPVRSFTAKQAEGRTVQEQDIILERSGGSADQPVGRVAIAGPGLEPCVPTDFQRLLRVDPTKALPMYVFWRLRHDWLSGLPRDYSRRTTGITNLSVKEYIAREILVPSAEEQVRLIKNAAMVEALLIGLQVEADRLRAVRTALLSNILAQTITIESTALEV